MTAILERSEMRDSLRALRSQRRGRRLRNLDVIDTMYRAYVVGLGIIAAFIGLAAVVGDARLAPATLADVRRDGPAIVGGVVALLTALGLRSGSHGGPLAFEAADVQHVMLAPVDRALIVRTAALKQARGVVLIGALAGGVVGVLAGPRLSGRDPLAWITCGVGFGIVAATAAWGSALLASTRRMPQAIALVLGTALTGWSVVDVVTQRTTSPLTMLGDLALLPLVRSNVGVVAVGVAAVAVIVAAGLAGAGRLSLEPVLHRAQLVRALRFAATIQDLRAVITLRRQLTHEQSATVCMDPAASDRADRPRRVAARLAWGVALAGRAPRTGHRAHARRGRVLCRRRPRDDTPDRDRTHRGLHRRVGPDRGARAGARSSGPGQ